MYVFYDFSRIPASYSTKPQGFVEPYLGNTALNKRPSLLLSN